MADFNPNTNETSEADLIVTAEDSRYTSLLCDEVVMDWLMNLEAEDCAADLDERRRDRHAQHAYC